MSKFDRNRISQRRLRKTLYKQTDKQTDRQDTTKIMVTWPWTNEWVYVSILSSYSYVYIYKQINNRAYMYDGGRLVWDAMQQLSCRINRQRVDNVLYARHGARHCIVNTALCTPHIMHRCTYTPYTCEQSVGYFAALRGLSLRYGHGAGNAVEENSSVCSLIRMR